MLTQNDFTEADFNDVRASLERQLADARTELGVVSLASGLSEDQDAVRGAEEAVETVERRLRSLQAAREQAERVKAAADAGRRARARLEDGRSTQAHLNSAAKHAENVERLAVQLVGELAAYNQDTATAASIGSRLAGVKAPSDLLQAVAFFPNPEAGYFAALIRRLGLSGVTEIDGHSAVSALGDKTFGDVFRERYAKVLSIANEAAEDALAAAA